MIEKVNPSHPDKQADRIAGAIVDLAYEKAKDPKVAVEVLLGHGTCKIIIESNEQFTYAELQEIVNRISGDLTLNVTYSRQDPILASNQEGRIRCGDNGIFRGVPVTQEQKALSLIARSIYDRYPNDGKYILAGDDLIICQSNATGESMKEAFPYLGDMYRVKINPLGFWTGGPNVDSGATNRKLGSDMGDAVTGGGLHGKDLSKADVSVNIYAHLMAQKYNRPIEYYCAIGDTLISDIPFNVMVETAREYIKEKGGFEKFAEWGLF